MRDGVIGLLLNGNQGGSFLAKLEAFSVTESSVVDAVDEVNDIGSVGHLKELIAKLYSRQGSISY